MKKSIRILMVSLSLVAIALTASAQAWRGTGRVQGVVIDKNTKKPVKGAKVILKSLRAGNVGPAPIVTNDKGKWALMGMLGGTWHVDVEADGYVTLQKSVEINELERIPPMELEIEPVPPPTLKEGSTVVQIGGKTIAPEVVASIEAGNNFMKEQKYKEAIVEYEKALAGAPEVVAIKRTLAQAYHGAGIAAEALRLLKELNDADPTNLNDAYALASLYLQNEKLAEAKSVLDRVPAEAFTDPIMMIEVGKHYYNANKGQDAHDYFNKAVTIDVARAESYYYRGLASLMMQKMADAKADFQKVVELAPDSPEAKEATDMLKSIK